MEQQPLDLVLGWGGAVPTGVLKKLNKRKFTDKDEILREVKFMKLEKSDALPHKGGLEVGEVETPSTLKSEGKTLKNRSNNQSDTSTRNSNIKQESLPKIKCENEMITPSQIIDPIDPITATAINLKIKGGYSFVHVVSMVNHGFNEAHSQKHQGIKEVFNHESEK